MPKQKLGTGNKRAVLQRPATSYTSPRALRLQQRRAKALDYRLQGRSYKAIGQTMKIHPSTAQDYVIRAMRDFVPKEKAEQVLEMELQRLDQMQSAVYQHAAAGDIAAIEICLKIQNQRARLLGLYPDKPSPVTVSFGGRVPNAEDEGIRVEFVRPSHNWDDDPRPIDVTPKPAPQLPRPDDEPTTDPMCGGPKITDFRAPPKSAPA
jgi:hypothetical protein